MRHKSSSRFFEKQYLRRVLVTVGVVLTVGLLVAVIWLSIRVWLAVFAGVLLAVFLSTLTRWVSRYTHVRRGWALASVLLVLLGLIVLGACLLAPRVVEQFTELAQRLPKAIEHIQQRAEQLGWSRYLPQKMPPVSELTSSVGKVVSNAASFFSLSVEAVATFFVIAFLGIYLAASPQVYLNGMIRLFPLSLRERVQELIDELGTTLGHWLLGQMLSMAVVGTLIAVGLTVLGVPLGLALGVLAGLLNFVPIIGSLLSALPAVLLAFLVSPLHPVYVIGLYVVVNTGIESHLLVPLIQRYAVNLPPAVAVLALFLMGELFGFIGLLLAIPLAAAMLVLVKKVYVRDVLGDSSVQAGKTKSVSGVNPAGRKG
jgi:predicted PurR-regulated permease PerM